MTIQRRRFLRAATGGSVLGLAGCTARSDGDPPAKGTGDGAVAQTTAPGVGDGELTLATTTSTWDTGLLNELNPVYESRFGVRVKAIPKGTGASLRTARDGDADVVLVHARRAEDAFLRDGVGVNRRDVMFNDFVVVGPADDPADIRGLTSATAAFAAIARTRSTFLSRGDDSGTHRKERAIWAEAGIEPSGTWYREIGKGMGDTLVQASQSDAYTLADRGTYLALQAETALVVHVQGPLEGGPPLLKNPYGVIPVNPAVHPNVNYQAAMAYVGFLTSPEGQGIIDGYTVNGSKLFFPNALAAEPDFAQYVPRGYPTDGEPSIDLENRGIRPGGVGGGHADF